MNLGLYAASLVLGVLALAACGTEGTPGAFTPESILAADTFEGWVARSSVVLTATISEIGPPLEDKYGFIFQTLSLTAEDVVKGPVARGDTFDAFLDEIGGTELLDESKIGRRILAVGRTSQRRTMRDGSTRDGYFLAGFASYLVVTRDDRQWGVRLGISPSFVGYGYDARRTVVENRLAEGMSVRGVDASPLGDLLGRARSSGSASTEQLGWRELEVHNRGGEGRGPPDPPPEEEP